MKIKIEFVVKLLRKEKPELMRWLRCGYAVQSNDICCFSDSRHILSEFIAEGDRVITRGIFKATQQGTSMGMPATVKQVTFSVIHLDRVENPKIVEP